VSIARRTIDDHTVIHQPLTGDIDIIHLIRLDGRRWPPVYSSIPVVRELNLRGFIAGRSEKYQRKCLSRGSCAALPAAPAHVQ
jgi:hypothetical protein